VVAESEEKAIEKFKIQNSKFKIDDIFQDEDVLDTWFSSWLWPMEVFKGISNPDNEDINYYYPTSVLVTGQDIIFFWVARMIMAGMEYRKQKPFSDVYFTGMVRDSQGRKMSKQLGNSPDLLHLIEKYGADALRFGIMISSPAGNDLLFDETSLEQGRNFNNKLWNALKLTKLWEKKVEMSQSGNGQLPMDNFPVQWFENRFNEVAAEVEILYRQFRLSEALKKIYSLIWDDFCSWYLEWIKPGHEQVILGEVYDKTIFFFEKLLQLLHPFMPFITEEIYHLLKEQTSDLIIKQFDRISEVDRSILKQGNILKEAVTAIRDAKNKNQVKPKEEIRLYIQSGDPGIYIIMEKILSKQINAKSIEFTDSIPANSLMVVVNQEKFYVEGGQQIDTGLQKQQMLKDLSYLKGFLKSVDNKLNNERFVQNARAEIIELEKKKKADAEIKIKVIEESLSALN
jgi:valyl-tRNA synthetase